MARNDNWVAGLNEALRAIFAGLDRRHANQQDAQDSERQHAFQDESMRFRREDQQMQRENQQSARSREAQSAQDRQREQAFQDETMGFRREDQVMQRENHARLMNQRGKTDTPVEQLAEIMRTYGADDTSRGHMMGAFTDSGGDVPGAIGRLQGMLGQVPADESMPDEGRWGVDESKVKRITESNKASGKERKALEQAMKMLKSYQQFMPGQAMPTGAGGAAGPWSGMKMTAPDMGKVGNDSQFATIGRQVVGMLTTPKSGETSYDANAIQRLQQFAQSMQSGSSPAEQAVYVQAMANMMPLHQSDYLRTVARRGQNPYQPMQSMSPMPRTYGRGDKGF